MTDRVEVRKTYKLFINGAFVRSESGRSYEVADAKGSFVANVSHASRKDARDAVVAARSAQPGWANATAYLRGQILFRVAEVMESRRAQFESELIVTQGLSDKKARKTVDAAIDRVVWYAGWTDKLSAVVGGVNPVAGPFINYSLPEPTGVIAVVAPQRDSLLGLVSVVAPVIATGNTTVVVTSHDFPIPAVTLSEVLATSDVPAGVVNILTGDYAEIAPWLAEHLDVDGIDLTGVDNSEAAKNLEVQAAVNVKRVVRPSAEDFSEEASITRLRTWTETKTVWQTTGA
jgi:acyl-CoA reductase-like NAD-dependent aldehyde dehydrogenase